MKQQLKFYPRSKKEFNKWQFIGIDEVSYVSKYVYKPPKQKPITVYVDWTKAIWFFFSRLDQSIHFHRCHNAHLHLNSTLNQIEVELENCETKTSLEELSLNH